MGYLDTQHSTDTNTSNYWSTKRIAQYALFVALSMALSFIEFPIIPGPQFSYLKYDPSGIVCLIAGYAYGPAAAAIVSILGFAPHILSNPLGSIIAISVSLGLSVTASFIYKKMRTKKGALLSLIAGSIVSIAIAIIGNLIITPLYLPQFTIADVASIIIPILLPFNAAKILLHIVLTVLIYKPISKLLKCYK